MNSNIPKISVLIICYKQEELIKRAINSLLAQKDYIYEICVSDDCSPDNTWQVLQDYDRKYPGLFKLHRNDPNIGIFENIEYTWTMPTGDIIYQLSGDDECGEGWFKSVVEYIRQNNIDYKNEMFCIYGDYKCIYPNGDSFTFTQDIVDKHTDAFRLAFRGMLCNRSTCFSINILNKYKPISQGRSHVVEDGQDRLLQIFSEKKYYIPQIGNIYYSQVGVSSSLTEEEVLVRVNIKQFTIRLYTSLGHKATKADCLYAIYGGLFELFAFNRKLKTFIILFWYYIRSIDFSLPFSLTKFKRLIFTIRRRFPHSKPIQM